MGVATIDLLEKVANSKEERMIVSVIYILKKGKLLALKPVI